MKQLWKDLSKATTDVIAEVIFIDVGWAMFWHYRVKTPESVKPMDDGEFEIF